MAPSWFVRWTIWNSSSRRREFLGCLPAVPVLPVGLVPVSVIELSVGRIITIHKPCPHKPICQPLQSHLQIENPFPFLFPRKVCFKKTKRRVSKREVKKNRAVVLIISAVKPTEEILICKPAFHRPNRHFT